MLLGKFEELVLLALLHQKGTPSTTADIYILLSDRTGKEASLGAIYTTLERMEEKHYVITEMSAPDNKKGGKSRKLYRITGLGQNSLRDSLSATQNMTRGISLAGAGGLVMG